ATDADRVLVLHRAALDGFSQRANVIFEEGRGNPQVERCRCVADGPRGEPEMLPAALFAQAVSDGLEEGGYVVVRLDLIAGDIRNVVACAAHLLGVGDRQAPRLSPAT